MKDVKEIIGIQKVDFTPEGRSDPIQGYKMFFLEDSVDNFYVGKRCLSYWVPESLKNGSFSVGTYEFDISISGGRARVTSVKKV